MCSVFGLGVTRKVRVGNRSHLSSNVSKPLDKSHHFMKLTKMVELCKCGDDEGLPAAMLPPEDK
jgi:hypothetical protein